VNDPRPNVWLVGDTEHSDFADAVALVRSTASVSYAAPEVIVFAESRPGMMSRREVERIRRSVPLAGIVSLSGSWCEGETRTGRPIAGATRLYWYEFPTWWRRQIELRSAGRCPEWARPDDFGLRISDCGLASGTVVVSALDFDSVDAISSVLNPAGFRTLWYRMGSDSIADVSAGIWLGGQLCDTELDELAAFCRVASPVVALVDFPRRDRYEAALAAGAAAVLGKPWSNSSLSSELQRAIDSRGLPKNEAA
jgi:hypothetical protein